MRTIWSLWQDALAEERTKPAYLVEEAEGWREVSWPEAAEAVDELANGLLAIGIGKGDAFGILAHTRLEWSLVDFALAQIGAVAAPIYPSSTPAESCYILEHSNAVGCLVETGLECDERLFGTLIDIPCRIAYLTHRPPLDGGERCPAVG